MPRDTKKSATSRPARWLSMPIKGKAVPSGLRRLTNSSGAPSRAMAASWGLAHTRQATPSRIPVGPAFPAGTRPGSRAGHAYRIAPSPTPRAAGPPPLKRQLPPSPGWQGSAPGAPPTGSAAPAAHAPRCRADNPAPPPQRAPAPRCRPMPSSRPRSSRARRWRWTRPPAPPPWAMEIAPFACRGLRAIP